MNTLKKTWYAINILGIKNKTPTKSTHTTKQQTKQTLTKNPKQQHTNNNKNNTVNRPVI